MADRDALEKYRSKRDFSITPEPSAGGKSRVGTLSFVVQKHWASHLHYDFRLEVEGTMKSWAVPKGPSLDPTVKRMAVQVEDHPISYSSFEGTIPPRQYGAGKVIVWDNGTWIPVGDPVAGLKSGHLKFELRGHKLEGNWALVRIKNRGEGQPPWLLIKEKDSFARSEADYSIVESEPDSVKNRKAATGKRKEPVPAGRKRPQAARQKSAPGAAAGDPPDGARRASLPAALAPQLATLAAHPPGDPQNWVCEVKFDGYRILTRVQNKSVRLYSRNGHDWSAKLASLRDDLAAMKLPRGWYDGEIVMPNEHGIPDFGALQQSFDSARTREIVYYLFDIPFVEQHDLRQVALSERRRILRLILASSTSQRVRFSEAFDGPLDGIVASACKLGLEGVIAKRLDSRYVSRRSTDWIKLKCMQRQEFVIGGFTDPQGSRTGFGALLLGVHGENGALEYAGDVGTGFNQKLLHDLRAKLDAIEVSASPFASGTRIAGHPHWVKPQLVAEVSFGEWTRAGRIRHSVFRGLRSDKRPRQITREKPVADVATRTSSAARGAAAKRTAATPKAAPTTAPKPLLSAAATAPRITHAERVIDTSTGITKLDVYRYYEAVGELMMPHLKGRPVALVRAPSGVGGEQFFQKHAQTQKMPGVRSLDAALDPEHDPMLEIASPAGLLSAAQWNVIEFHTQNATKATFQRPDRIVFDLDPGERVPWSQMQEAAELVRSFIEQLGLAAFLKTSGGKGLHVVVPIRKLHDAATVKEFAHAIVAHLAKTIPQRFVEKSGPKNRVGKIFIDYLRNGPGATTACAWSARARPGLGISVPVQWTELDALSGGNHWTIRNAGERLRAGNTPWNDYPQSARSMSAAMKTLGYQPGNSS